jgi:hypothetical protein
MPKRKSAGINEKAPGLLGLEAGPGATEDSCFGKERKPPRSVSAEPGDGGRAGGSRLDVRGDRGPTGLTVTLHSLDERANLSYRPLNEFARNPQQSLSGICAECHDSSPA